MIPYACAKACIKILLSVCEMVFAVKATIELNATFSYSQFSPSVKCTSAQFLTSTSQQVKRKIAHAMKG